jgi:hypothetical protein
MEELAGNAHISFEGNLRGLRLLNIPGASEDETVVLKRNTQRPKQDFIVVPLERSMGKTILSAIGGNIPRKILHVQVEKVGLLEFGAYDNFHHECIFFGPALNSHFLEALVSRGVLKSWKERTNSRKTARKQISK